ncbi:hypothetical protein HAHI6034_09165 [Hathewaya histolytica]|uniref:Amino acid permease n=1 Tax=Hathewaya histolytica TaxID=1498 RepID=A0A4U9RN44_HATHI|nr:hypothetical protein [Hathewaya histolytica]VTQ93429.1 Amino acid permease [Hathewaya histolytica]
MRILMALLSTLLFAAIGFVIFAFLREFVFSKVKVNKWIILSITILIVVLTSYFGVSGKSILGRYILPTIYVIFFLWFLDTSGLFNAVESKGKTYEQNKNRKKDVIRPKAKPNRVKNTNKNDK